MSVSELRPRQAHEVAISSGLLSGYTVIVTRPTSRASKLLQGLRDQQAKVVLAAAVETGPPEDPAPLQRAIAVLPDGFDWVVFTSATGVEALDDALSPRPLSEALCGVRTAVIGTATAEALRSHDIEPDLLPPEAVAESLAQALLDEGVTHGCRLLLPRAAAARASLPRLLQEAGAEITDVAAYQTVNTSGAISEQTALLAREAMATGHRCLLTFTSPSTVLGFQSMVGSAAAAMLEPLASSTRPRVASIGPVTSAAIEDLGWPVDIEAQPHDVQGLIEATIRLASNDPEESGPPATTGATPC